jgi:hypothetical protein
VSFWPKSLRVGHELLSGNRYPLSPSSMSFPRRRGSRVTGTGGSALDSRLRGNYDRGWESGCTRLTEVHDLRADFWAKRTRKERPKHSFPQSGCGQLWFRKSTNRFSPLSEKWVCLSPHDPAAVDSPHRRTESEIMTSDWCSEAGWFGCRSGSGQAGRVLQA